MISSYTYVCVCVSVCMDCVRRKKTAFWCIGERFWPTSKHMMLLFRKAAREKVLLKRINRQIPLTSLLHFPFPSKADTLSLSHHANCVQTLYDPIVFA